MPRTAIPFKQHEGKTISNNTRRPLKILFKKCPPPFFLPPLVFILAFLCFFFFYSWSRSEAVDHPTTRIIRPQSLNLKYLNREIRLYTEKPSGGESHSDPCGLIVGGFLDPIPVNDIWKLVFGFWQQSLAYLAYRCVYSEHHLDMSPLSTSCWLAKRSTISARTMKVVDFCKGTTVPIHVKLC